MHVFVTLALCVFGGGTLYAGSSVSTAPAVAGDHSKESFEEAAYKWTRTFAEMLHLVDTHHYQVNNVEECMIRSMDAFLSTLDPHSAFLDPKMYKLMLESTSGEFFGIGVIIDNTRNARSEFLTVIDTIADGPSDKVGVKPLDKIIEVDGAPLRGLATEEIIARLKGKRNTVVTIKVMREGHPDLLTFRISRDTVKEQTSLAFYLPDYNVSYVSLNTFTRNAATRIRNLVGAAQEKSQRGIILDLRNNSGGLLSSAIEIAGLFLDSGSLVVTTKTKKSAEPYLTTGSPVVTTDLPVIILINNYTASAAEILAGVLKSYSERFAQEAGEAQQRRLMVFLVGTTTFGKGSVQDIIPVGNNCAVKLTFSLYFLPGDLSLQGVGITPDFVVEKSFPPSEQVQWFKKNFGREQALQNYIKNQQQPAESSAASTSTEVIPSGQERWMDRTKKSLAEDNQLREAITILNIIECGRTCAPSRVRTRSAALDFIRSLYVGDKPLVLVNAG